MDTSALEISSYPKRNINGDTTCDVVGCKKHKRLQSHSGLQFCIVHWRTVKPFLPPVQDGVDLRSSLAEATKVSIDTTDTATLCSVADCYSKSVYSNRMQELCQYHMGCWYKAAIQLVDVDGKPQCHAKCCDQIHQLTFAHSRLWCNIHYEAISKIRARITHYHTMDSFNARLEEACFTKNVDEGHSKCINYIGLHLSQKLSMGAQAWCCIIDCYNTNTTEHEQQGKDPSKDPSEVNGTLRWCSTHQHLAKGDGHTKNTAASSED